MVTAAPVLVGFPGIGVPYVADICRLVGGMPLGIELASTWVRMLSCREIKQQIEQSLDFLETSLRNVPERHRSLRAVFERSWQLLTEQERQTFRELAVFRGGFTAGAAATVTGASLPVLLALADKSLLHRNDNGRYQIPPVLRQYATEKFNAAHGGAGEWQALRDRHCDYFARFLAEREGALKGEEQMQALAEIGTDIENVRRAAKWAIENGRVQTILQAAEALYVFYEMQSWFEEGAEICQQAAARFEPDMAESEALQGLVGGMLAGAGAFQVRLARYEQGRELLERALTLIESLADAVPPSNEAFIHSYLGIIAEAAGDYERARELYKEGLALFQQIGDRLGIAFNLEDLGNVAFALGKRDEAERHYWEALTVARAIPAVAVMLDALVGLAQLRASAGDWETALAWLALVRTHEKTTPQTQERAEMLWEAWNGARETAVVENQHKEDRHPDLMRVVNGIIKGASLIVVCGP